MSHKQTALQLMKKVWNPLGYEIHHIVPRSLGGSDDWDNLVPLLPEDHKQLHIELANDHPELKSLKAVQAFIQKDPEASRYLKQYASSKSLRFTGKTHTEEWKIKHSKWVSENQKAERNPMFRGFVEFLCLETKTKTIAKSRSEIFALGFHPDSINRCLRNNQEIFKNHRIRRVQPNEIV